MVYTLVRGRRFSFEDKLEREIKLIEGTGRRVVSVQFSSCYDKSAEAVEYSALIAHEELN